MKSVTPVARRFVRAAASTRLGRVLIGPVRRRRADRHRASVEDARRAAEQRAVDREAGYRQLVLIEESGDSAEALRFALELSDRFPEGAKIAIAASRLAAKWERWDRAQQVLDRLSGRAAASAVVGLAQVSLHLAREEIDEALHLLDGLLATHPDEVKVHVKRSSVLIEIGRFDEASESIDRLAGLPGASDMPERLALALADARFDTDGALRIVERRVAAKPNDVGLRVDLCFRRLKLIEHEFEAPESLIQAIDADFELLERTAGHDQRVIQLGVHLAVRSDDVDEVEALLARVRPDWRHRWLFGARAWVAMKRSRPIAEVRRIWEESERHHFVPQFRPCTSGELVGLGTPPPRDADEIRVFTVVRNERWRIPWFLDYYRSIGVDRFFFVDNGSTDGTRELLLGEPDVHVFHTEVSYSRGRSGMVWVNNLVAEHGTVGWNLYVDVDEAIVFPGVDEIGLRGLTSYLDAAGHEVVAGHMLDMHASETVPLDADGFERDFIGRYPFFDPVYRTVGTVECPYFRVRGGVRRHLHSMAEQTKTPLFKAGRNIRMRSSSHVVTPAIVSDVRCVLLHYKLAGDYRETFRADVEDNSRRPFCRRRHLAYLAALEQLDGAHPDLTSDVSLKYESWRTVDALGLIGAPDRFRERFGW